ncbi:MAG: fumarylacetoacetase [Gammaproteobacteria bacterium]|nr:fumarylacetoacetase [Gammaproteobacteria bacterium]
MFDLNETHDPSLASWLESANDPNTDFPIQNLPLAVFRRRDSGETFRGGIAIGDQILDLAATGISRLGVDSDVIDAVRQQTLNRFMALGSSAWTALRLGASRALRLGAGEIASLQSSLVPQKEAEYQVAAQIGDYTDFYTSLYHATNVGRLFRPDNPLMPNYQWIPIGYHGRSSSIAVSGQQVYRPLGQLKSPDDQKPRLGPSRRMDYELELGVFIGSGNELGDPVDLDHAERHIFGLCLLNDWSARDIQMWEYQPLGPFLAKNFATTISPWIVSTEALTPYRLAWNRPDDHPQPLPYLESAANRAAGSLDIWLEVLLHTSAMKATGMPPQRVSLGNFRHAYWTLAQMVTHHTVNGCNLRPGDLLGTGTQSGPGPDEAGTLLELTQGGQSPVELPNGETRTFLEDGDTVIMRGWCESEGRPRLGFGEVAATLLPTKM